MMKNNQTDMINNVKALYPDYCRLCEHAAYTRGLNAGADQRIAKYEQVIADYQRLIERQTGLIERQRKEILTLKEEHT